MNHAKIELFLSLKMLASLNCENNVSGVDTKVVIKCFKILVAVLVEKVQDLQLSSLLYNKNQHRIVL